MLKIKSFTFNAFQENTYVVSLDNKCFIVDPGNSSDEENEELMLYISSNKLIPEYVLITHCHVDHVLGTNFLTTSFSIKAYLPESEKKIYDEMVSYAPLFGFENYNNSKDIKYITKDSKLLFNGLDVDILLLPGHSPGHLAFYFDRAKKCFSGDVIFKNSIGRTDLPGGNYETLINSIKNELFLLDDNVQIYPGHGPITNIYDEKHLNPFLI
jgi:glyoxylase-like metal-dependent hydrolase (beta-lactamase superfamily II)|tara:strand:+ start:52 stop:687 length:636 start_codon:yes stop_codon:yes gene_type:complete